jgi:hypothetical protein
VNISFFYRLLNNIAINSWVSQFIQLGTNLFILPIILIKFNSPEVALWFFLQTLIGFGLLADSGFGSNLTRAVSYFKAGSKDIVEKDVKVELIGINPNYIGLNNLYYTSKLIYNVLSFISVGILFFVGFWTTKNLISLTTDSRVGLSSFYIVIVTCFIQIFNIRQISFLTGLGHVVLLKRVDSLFGILKFISLLVLLLLVPRLDYLFIAILIIQLLKNIIIKLIVKKRLITLGVELKRSKFNVKIFKQIWKPTWKTSLMNISAYLINFSSSLVIVQITNASIIVDFLFTQRIFNFITNISINPFYSKIPHLASLFVKDRREDLFKTFSVYHGLSILVYSIGAIATLFFGNYILDTFIENSSARLISTPLLLIFIVTLLLELNHSIFAGLYLITNDVPFVIPSIVSGVTIFLLSYFGVPYFGLEAVILTPFIVQLCFNNWYPLYKVSSHFNINILKLLLVTPINLAKSIYGKQ